VACIPVGHHPMGLAYDARHKLLYAACEGAGTLEVIELPAFTRRKPIALGDVYPVSVALTPDGATAWTANFFGSSVMEVDLAAGQVRRALPVGSVAEGVAAPADAPVVIAATRNGVVWFDRVSGAELGRTQVSPYAAAFFRSADDRWSVIDTADWKLFPLDVRARAAGVAAAAPARARALLVDPATGDILAGDCERGAVVRFQSGQGLGTVVANVEFPMGIALCPVP